MTKRKAIEDITITKPAPGPKTSAAIRNAQEKHDALPPRPYMSLEEDAEGGALMTAPHSDTVGHSAWLLSSLGTTSASFLTQQLNSIGVATAGTGVSGDTNVDGINAALALLGAIGPTDELEGALATQMVGCHALSMSMLCRAKSTTRADHLQLYGNLAVKLQRTFTAQVEALARLRGKGQQTVRVEHVTVQPGGQAIVGDVHHHARGAITDKQRTEDQPHETGPTRASSTRAALPSPDPQGNGVPIALDAQRPLSHSRRPVTRRTLRESERLQARQVEHGDDRVAQVPADNASGAEGGAIQN